MIIIEGPDNSGKSILAKHLSQSLKLKIWHSPGPNTKEQLYDSMDFVMKQEELILDRVPCISEQIYGPVLRGKNLLQDTGLLEKLIEEKDPIFIYCRPSTDIIVSKKMKFRLEESEDHKRKVVEEIYTLITIYDTCMQGVPHILYDWPWVSPMYFDLLVQHCKTYLIWRRDRERR